MECDHDLIWVDDSFDHEFGCQVCGHWECEHCDKEFPDLPPPEYGPQPDDYF